MALVCHAGRRELRPRARSTRHKRPSNEIDVIIRIPETSVFRWFTRPFPFHRHPAFFVGINLDGRHFARENGACLLGLRHDGSNAAKTGAHIHVLRAGSQFQNLFLSCDSDVSHCVDKFVHVHVFVVPQIKQHPWFEFCIFCIFESSESLFGVHYVAVASGFQ